MKSNRHSEASGGASAEKLKTKISFSCFRAPASGFVSFKNPLRIAQFSVRLSCLALSTSFELVAAGDREVQYWIGNTCASINEHLVDDFFLFYFILFLLACDSLNGIRCRHVRMEWRRLDIVAFLISPENGMWVECWMRERKVKASYLS